ncbi:hypothetical protein D3C72_2177080 [compost metagenome]
MTTLKASSDASSNEPTPAPAINRISSRPSCRPKMVAPVLRTPNDSPWLIDSTAPEPGDTAIRHDAAKKASQVCKSMKHRACEREEEGDAS